MKPIYTFSLLLIIATSLYSQTHTATSDSYALTSSMPGYESEYRTIDVSGVSEIRLRAYVSTFDYGFAELLVFSSNMQMLLNQIEVSGTGLGSYVNDEQVFMVPSNCVICLSVVDQASTAAFSYDVLYTTPNAQVTNHLITTAETPVSLEHNILFHAKDKYTVSAAGNAILDDDQLFDGILSNIDITGGSVSSANPYVLTVDNLPNIEPEGKSYIGFISAENPPLEFIIEGNTSAGWQTFAYADNNTSKDYLVEVDNSCTKFIIRIYDIPNSSTLGIAEVVFIQSTVAIPYDGLYVKSEGQQDLKVSGTIYQPTETGIKISDLSDKIVFKATTTQTEIHAAGSGGTVIKGDGDDDLVTIKDGGDVGIGTSSPTERLTIVDGDVLIGTSTENSPESGRIRLTEYSGGSYLGSYIHYDGLGNALHLGRHLVNDSDASNDLNSLSILNTNGYVGIGINSPSGLLHLNDNSGGLVINKLSTGVSSMKPAQIGWGEASMGAEGDLILAPRTDVSTTSIRFFTNDGTDILERVRINEKGYVGIGTSSPGAELAVAGSILAHEVIITTDVNTYPDYVFGKDYDLMPLVDLRTFIEVNCHLPGVPTAEEAAKEGIKVAEMNKVLLKKIEELTLYILQTNRELDKMKLQMSELELENSRLRYDHSLE